ncbi:MAG: fructokinase [Spirochaetaceae bacterium]|nr:MAG: fructokinase [Spirochaetaceae bacterium]
MIVHTGEALIDFLPVRDSNGRTAFLPVPGGSPYNTSVAAARLEVPNAFLGRISRDFFGDQLVSYLEENGVGTDMITRDDALSTLAFVKKLDSGAVRYAFSPRGRRTGISYRPISPAFPPVRRRSSSGRSP